MYLFLKRNKALFVVNNLCTIINIMHYGQFISMAKYREKQRNCIAHILYIVYRADPSSPKQVNFVPHWMVIFVGCLRTASSIKDYSVRFFTSGQRKVFRTPSPSLVTFYDTIGKVLAASILFFVTLPSTLIQLNTVYKCYCIVLKGITVL